MKQFRSVLTHGETGNTQMGSQKSTKSLRLQLAVHNYCSWSPHNKKVTIKTGLQ